MLKDTLLGPIDEGYLLEVSKQLAEYVYSHQEGGKSHIGSGKYGPIHPLWLPWLLTSDGDLDLFVSETFADVDLKCSYKSDPSVSVKKSCP